MPRADPDFLSDVETNRFQVVTSATPKTRERSQKQKREYTHETVHLRIPVAAASSSSSAVRTDAGAGGDGDSDGGAFVDWKVPRFRLTQQFLQDVVHRVTSQAAAKAGPVPPRSTWTSTRADEKAPPSAILSHLRETDADAIVFPHEMRSKCRPAPVRYRVVTRSAGRVLVRNPNHRGNVVFVIENAPGQSHNGRYDVKGEDVKNWIVRGAVDDHDEIIALSRKLKKTREAVGKIEDNLKNLPRAPLHNDRGKALAGNALVKAREKKERILRDQILRLGREVEEAHDAVERARVHHFAKFQLTVARREASGYHGNSCDPWTVKILGSKEERDCYTNLVLNKTDWSLCRMYAGSKTPVPPAAKQADHMVDVEAVTLEMVADGYGIYEGEKGAPRKDTIDGGATSQIGLGEFRDGKMCGHGTLYTSAGVYTGELTDDQPHGQGKIEYVNGTTISGRFACSPDVKDHLSARRPNPYRRGLPHGQVRVEFPDGSSYEGEMRHGTITGKGVYRRVEENRSNAYSSNNGLEKNHEHRACPSFGESRGSFLNGVLKNDHGNDGRRHPNPLDSFLFEGRRSWRGAARGS